MRTLPREPWLGSQICGYEVDLSDGRTLYCGELKAERLWLCAVHAEEFADAYDGFNVPVADFVAKGCRTKGVRLLWQPEDGHSPEEPTAAETAAYAASVGAS